MNNYHLNSQCLDCHFDLLFSLMDYLFVLTISFYCLCISVSVSYLSSPTSAAIYQLTCSLFSPSIFLISLNHICSKYCEHVIFFMKGWVAIWTCRFVSQTGTVGGGILCHRLQGLQQVGGISVFFVNTYPCLLLQT